MTCAPGSNVSHRPPATPSMGSNGSPPAGTAGCTAAVELSPRRRCWRARRRSRPDQPGARPARAGHGVRDGQPGQRIRRGAPGRGALRADRHRRPHRVGPAAGRRAPPAGLQPAGRAHPGRGRLQRLVVGAHHGDRAGVRPDRAGPTGVLTIGCEIGGQFQRRRVDLVDPPATTAGPSWTATGPSGARSATWWWRRPRSAWWRPCARGWGTAWRRTTSDPAPGLHVPVPGGRPDRGPRRPGRPRRRRGGLRPRAGRRRCARRAVDQHPLRGGVPGGPRPRGHPGLHHHADDRAQPTPPV